MPLTSSPPLRVVRASIRPYVHQDPCMLEFWNFVYGFLMEKVDARFFFFFFFFLFYFFFFFFCFFLFFCFCPSYLPFWSYAPLKKSELNLMHAISYEPCMLWFHMDSSWKNSWNVFFFSCPSYLPFWSYAPYAKSGWNLVSKISQKVFELAAWKLISW